MEGDTIILSEHEVISGLLKEEDAVNYPQTVDGRTIRVAHLYVHARIQVNRCLQICAIDLFTVSSLSSALCCAVGGGGVAGECAPVFTMIFSGLRSR